MLNLDAVREWLYPERLADINYVSIGRQYLLYDADIPEVMRVTCGSRSELVSAGLVKQIVAEKRKGVDKQLHLFRG